MINWPINVYLQTLNKPVLKQHSTIATLCSIQKLHGFICPTVYH